MPADQVCVQVTDGLPECFSPSLCILFFLVTDFQAILAEEVCAGTMHCEVELHQTHVDSTYYLPTESKACML